MTLTEAALYSKKPSIKRKYMNFHNTSANARLLDSVRESHQQSKDSKEVYESVSVKHFQIIQTFLQKINELYNKHDQFENTLGTLEDKVQKLEVNTKNIHYQFRTTHLMLDKKLNTINTDYNNLQEQMKLIQMDMPIDSYLSSSHFLAKTHNLRSRNKKNKKKIRKNSDQYKIQVHSNQDLAFTSPGFHPRDSEGRDDKMVELGVKAEEALRLQKVGSFRQKIVSFDAVSSNSSRVNIQTPGEVSMMVIGDNEQPQEEEDDQQYRKIDEQVMRAEIKRQTEIIQQKLSQEMKKCHELNDSLKQQFQAELSLKISSLTQDLATLQSKILQNLDQKIEKIKESLQTKLQTESKTAKEELFAYNKELMVNFEQIDVKMAQKVNLTYFQESLNNLSLALSGQFAKQDKLYSNKVQTKRALDFIQKKINRWIAEQQSVKSKKQLNGNEDPCLKINKCESVKKIDWMSEKSIKDRLEDGNYGSLDTSMKEIQGTQKHISWKDDSSSKLKRVISNIISWRNPILKTAVAGGENKAMRSTTKIKQMGRSTPSPTVSKRLSVHAQGINPTTPSVNIKEWREKVVKILKKQDRRKRKVTFR